MQTVSKHPTPSARMPVVKGVSKALPDAVDLLVDDHKQVKKLFKEYEKLSKKNDIKGKVAVALKICDELTVHTHIEEEIFYPALLEAMDEKDMKDMLDEAVVEHATCKDLIAQIRSSAGTHPLYDAKVKVLNEYIEHHVKEEETEMFPKARKSRLDLDFFGMIMQDRKQELKNRLN